MKKKKIRKKESRKEDVSIYYLLLMKSFLSPPVISMIGLDLIIIPIIMAAVCKYSFSIILSVPNSVTITVIEEREKRKEGKKKGGKKERREKRKEGKKKRGNKERREKRF